MPQYLISVWHDDTYEVDFSTPDAQRRVAQVGAFNDELQTGRRLGVRHRPAPSIVGHSRAIHRTEVSMTDGPYAETKEQMGGIWIIAASDLDAALEWASKAAAACEGPVEVRPAQG